MAQSVFVEKIEQACHKKEWLFERSKSKYALRSLIAGMLLTLTPATGVIAADVLNTVHPSLGRFAFPFSSRGGWCISCFSMRSSPLPI